MEPTEITVQGAREHNLKDVSVTIPRYRLVVFTGVSGSGKSSLALDTLYAEGQRRYVESLSSYARQFLGQMQKPRVDAIFGLSPAIAIEQRPISKNPRSTVGTVTEIYDYLRVLYARLGQLHCPQCGQMVQAQTPQQMARQVLETLPNDRRFLVLAPLVRGRRGTHKALFERLLADGYARVRADGEILSLDEAPELAKTHRHDVDVVLDRLQAPVDRSRLTESIENALTLSGGLALVATLEGEEWLMSETNACPSCEISLPAPSPQLFSFNSPVGMCLTCNGLGVTLEIDPSRIVPDPARSLHEGAIRLWGDLGKKRDSWTYRILSSVAAVLEFDFDTPWQDLPESAREALLNGTGDEPIPVAYESDRHSVEINRPLEGAVSIIRRRYRQTKSDGARRFYTSFMSPQTCPDCGGGRLRPEAMSTTVGGLTIGEVTAMPVNLALMWVEGLEFSGEDRIVADEIVQELQRRLAFLLNVGLHYITLDRPAPSLSGGEGQRIRLASQLGCGLVGVLYILDEPSVGLHPRDNRRLIDTLIELRDMGNTVLVVEHDSETIRAADYIVDLGPGAGVEGGHVVAAGTLEDIMGSPRSLTGQYLSGKREVVAPNGHRRTPGLRWLTIRGAQHHNLKEIDVSFPAGLLTCVTGVSGSGKSSLVSETLYPALARHYHGAHAAPGIHERIEGLHHFNKIINITQEPIGRTPRSNPATYAELFGIIRKLLSQTPTARARGYSAGRFSFNTKGGRCEACKGHGQRLIEMHFLPDVWVVCDECGGARYNRETLEITYRGRTIADVLAMDVAEALEFFANVPAAARILQTLHDVGLGYIQLGQSATTLSGGEAQRVKLAKELARVSTGDTIYILDEPTTGLHFADIQRLLDVLHRLTDAGNTVIVIEHNLDVIKTADWIIDLGPEGGEAGGYIVAEGPPETVARTERSHTGHCLQGLLPNP
jgi:excinuclease ABC subunit A